MNRTNLFINCVLLLALLMPAFSQEKPQELDNPITVAYLQKQLPRSQPRLVLNAKIERELKRALKSDPVVQNMYAAIKLNAETIFDEPLLERELVGRRLLGVSREMLWRVNMLGMVYRIEKDAQVLDRINDELLAVCRFSDWNPSHFLDVAEMSMAVALALDWTAGDLPASTIELAEEALIEKGIKPSWNGVGGSPGWVNGHNNWNQVCHGGMIAAAITIAEKEPELAAKTISRALDGMVYALAQYAPDGVYPEGSTYWSYGTSFTVVTAAMFESAFGTDFGIADYPALMESAVFRYLMNTPSGWYYNFADCGDRRSNNGDVVLAWFASKTGKKAFFEEDRFLQPANEMEKLSRLAGAALVWISQYDANEDSSMPTAWKGEGENPVVVFRGGEDDSRGYYLGGKGGRATTSHGNMDAGSFIFELNGVRWVIDPGNQGYHDLERVGFDLWGRCQQCDRWSLLTKNNFGHSTLTVNDALFVNDGYASLEDFSAGTKGAAAEKGQSTSRTAPSEATGLSGTGFPYASFDLKAVFGENVESAVRTFIKDSEHSVVIEDQVTINENTKRITWQMMTTAEVELTETGALLKQEGQELKIINLSHPNLQFSVISLDPPPLELDRRIENLKRLELHVPAWTIENDKTGIKIRLTGE
jgi:hypothetical protein